MRAGVRIRVVYTYPRALRFVAAKLRTFGILGMKEKGTLRAQPEICARNQRACSERWLPGSYYGPDENLLGAVNPPFEIPDHVSRGENS
jgi:hypothetical protein